MRRGYNNGQDVGAVMPDWIKRKAEGEHTRKWKTGGRVNNRFSGRTQNNPKGKSIKR